MRQFNNLCSPQMFTPVAAGPPLSEIGKSGNMLSFTNRLDGKRLRSFGCEELVLHGSI